MSLQTIVATYKVRDEPASLVADLRANLAGLVDAFVELCQARTGGWQHEGESLARQRQLVRRETGGQPTWVLFVDPDERFEDNASSVIREAVERAPFGTDTQFQFPLREMWTPTQWRCDGDWAHKKPRTRMYHLHPGQQFRSKPIHCGVAPLGPRGKRVTLPCAMYHLKNIEPENRVARAAAYLAADPRFEHQQREGQDWSWLHDEAGLALADIEPGRGFSPAYLPGSYRFTVPGRELASASGSSPAEHERG